MEFSEIMDRRFSMRSFQGSAVDETRLQAILEAANKAPCTVQKLVRPELMRLCCFLVSSLVADFVCSRDTVSNLRRSIAKTGFR